MLTEWYNERAKNSDITEESHKNWVKFCEDHIRPTVHAYLKSHKFEINVEEIDEYNIDRTGWRYTVYIPSKNIVAYLPFDEESRDRLKQEEQLMHSLRDIEDDLGFNIPKTLFHEEDFSIVIRDTSPMDEKIYASSMRPEDDGNEQAMQSIGTALAKLHKLTKQDEPSEVFPWTTDITPNDMREIANNFDNNNHTRNRLLRFVDYYERAEKLDSKSVLVHGDLGGAHNIVLNKSDSKVYSIFDYEYSQYSHPYVDLGQIVSCQYPKSANLIIQSYEQEMGEPVDQKLLYIYSLIDQTKADLTFQDHDDFYHGLKNGDTGFYELLEKFEEVHNLPKMDFVGPPSPPSPANGL